MRPILTQLREGVALFAVILFVLALTVWGEGFASLWG